MAIPERCSYCQVAAEKACVHALEAGACGRGLCNTCAFTNEGGRPVCRAHRPSTVTESPSVRFNRGKYGPHRYPPDGLELERIHSDYFRWVLAEWSWDGPHARALLYEISLLLHLRLGRARA